MTPFDAASSPAQVIALTPRAPRLSDFGLERPLTDRQAELVQKLATHGGIAKRFGYVATDIDNPVLQSLERLGLAASGRERVGPLGPNCRTLTVWWLEPQATGLAFALKRGGLLTAETIARAANDRSAA